MSLVGGLRAKVVARSKGVMWSPSKNSFVGKNKGALLLRGERRALS